MFRFPITTSGKKKFSLKLERLDGKMCFTNKDHNTHNTRYYFYVYSTIKQIIEARQRSKVPASNCGARSFWRNRKIRSVSSLFDDFRNEKPEDFLAGFPCIRIRGIETITYVLAGTVHHGDSMGTKENLQGRHPVDDGRSGIMHQEMPKGDQQEECTDFNSGLTFPRP